MGVFLLRRQATVTTWKGWWVGPEHYKWAMDGYISMTKIQNTWPKQQRLKKKHSVVLEWANISLETLLRGCAKRSGRKYLLRKTGIYPSFCLGSIQPCVSGHLTPPTILIRQYTILYVCVGVCVSLSVCTCVSVCECVHVILSVCVCVFVSPLLTNFTHTQSDCCHTELPPHCSVCKLFRIK